MIINLNPITLYKSGATMAQTMISSHTSEISNDSVDSVKIRAQIGFFLSVEKMLESPTNALDVVGFEGNKYELKFDYPTSDRNVFWFFDLKIKEYLLQCFPSWDANLLLVTTDPDFVMPE